MKWAAIVALLTGAACCAIRFSCRAITVVGSSMEPTFCSGDRLLAVSRRLRAPRPGDVVVFRHPVAYCEPRLLVKRLREVDPTAPTKLIVQGDAHDSLDSRAFGPIALETVYGVVVARLRGAPGPKSSTVGRAAMTDAQIPASVTSRPECPGADVGDAGSGRSADVPGLRGLLNRAN
jgi:signal peptidase I